MPASRLRGLTTAVLLFLVLTPAWAFAGAPVDDFLSPDQAFDFQVSQRSSRTVELSWDIAPGYYLYPDKFTVKIANNGPVDDDIEWPSRATARDPFNGVIPAYKHHLAVMAPIGQAHWLTVTWQGCAQAGLCYAAQHRRVDLSGTTPVVSIPDALMPSPSRSGNQTQLLARDQALAADLSAVNTAWTLAVFFGLGVLLAFTPCVLPMLPILSSVIVGAGATAGRSLLLSLCFITTMALTYAALGVGAALSGLNLLALTQTPAVLLVMAAIFLVLALSMFGVFEVQLPPRLRSVLDRAHRRQRSGQIRSAMVMGALSALLVSPCMTPPLAGALLYISQSGNIIVGGAALLCLGLGMGMPLVLVSTVGTRFLPPPGRWMKTVNYVFSLILLATAAYLLERVFVVADVVAMGALTLLVTIAICYGNLKSRPARILFALAAISLAVALVYRASPAPRQDTHEVIASFHPPIRVHSLSGLDRLLKQSGDQDRLTLVTYSAQWCVACHHNANVLSQPRIQQALEDWRWIQVDVTKDDQSSRVLLGRYRILGPPTTIILGPNGSERRASRITGEFSKNELLGVLGKARRATDLNRLLSGP